LVALQEPCLRIDTIDPANTEGILCLLLPDLQQAAETDQRGWGDEVILCERALPLRASSAVSRIYIPTRHSPQVVAVGRLRASWLQPVAAVDGFANIIASLCEPTAVRAVNMVWVYISSYRLTLASLEQYLRDEFQDSSIIVYVGANSPC
jgi:hypothetical protein